MKGGVYMRIIRNGDSVTVETNRGEEFYTLEEFRKVYDYTPPENVSEK